MSEDNQKRNLIAVAVSALLLLGVAGAWVCLTFLGGDGAREATAKSDEPEAAAEVAEAPQGGGTAQTKATDERETAQTEESPPFDADAFAEIKEQAKRGYDAIQADLRERKAGAADATLNKALGKMAGGIGAAETAEAANDLPLAQKEYQGVVRQVDYFHGLREVIARRDAPKMAKAQQWAKFDAPFSKDDSKPLRTAFAELESQIVSAGEAFDANDFQLATEQLEAAAASLDTLAEDVDSIVSKYWNIAGEALEGGDRQRAEAALLVVENIEPTRAGLADAKQRAATIDIVRPKELQALEYEDAELFELAKGLYDEIARIDPLSAIARDGAARVGDILEKRAIEATGTALSQAMAAGEWKRAEGLLQDLKALDPNDSRIENFGTQIKRELDRLQIARLKSEALMAESRRDWQTAKNIYEQILLINDTLEDIKDNYERARTGLAYEESALDAIQRAERHAEYDETARLDKALHLLVEAKKRPGLKTEIHGRVDSLVEQYTARRAELTKPVVVRLVSDGQTRVNVWKVGNFDPFTEMELTLKPGAYTVQGLRAGFAEKFIEVVVKPLQEGQVFEVLCDE